MMIRPRKGARRGSVSRRCFQLNDSSGGMASPVVRFAEIFSFFYLYISSIYLIYILSKKKKSIIRLNTWIISKKFLAQKWVIRPTLRFFIFFAFGLSFYSLESFKNLYFGLNFFQDSRTVGCFWVKFHFLSQHLNPLNFLFFRETCFFHDIFCLLNINIEISLIFYTFFITFLPIPTILSQIIVIFILSFRYGLQVKWDTFLFLLLFPIFITFTFCFQ